MTGPSAAKRILKLFAGPAAMVAARIGGALCAVLYTMLLARSMGAAAAGEVAVSISLAMVLALACTLNIESGAVRFMVQDLAQGRFAQAAGYVRFSRRYILAISTIVTVAALTYVWSRGHGPGTPLFLAVLAAPVLGWMRVGAGISMGFSRVILANLPRTLLLPLFMVIGVGTWVGLIGTPTPLIGTALFLGTCVIAVLIQNRILRPDVRKLSRDLGAEPYDVRGRRDWVRIGLTLGLNVLFIEYSVYVTVLAASFVLDKADLARLDVVLKVIGILRFALIAINQYYSPKISRAMGMNNADGLRWLLGVSGAMKLTVLAIGGSAIWFLSALILKIFGHEYAVAQTALLILLIDPLLIAVFGPGSTVVGFSKRPHMLLPFLGSTLFVLVAGAYFGGLHFGLIGVVASVIAARATWTLGLAMYSWFALSIDPTVFSAAHRLWVRRPKK